MRLTICNRCKHYAPESEFEGQEVNIFDQGGSGDEDGEFILCDPCIVALREWMNGKPRMAGKAAGGRAGGAARAAKLTPERRSEIAKQGAKARWSTGGRSE